MSRDAIVLWYLVTDSFRPRLSAHALLRSLRIFSASALPAVTIPSAFSSNARVLASRRNACAASVFARFAFDLASVAAASAATVIPFCFASASSVVSSCLDTDS